MILQCPRCQTKYNLDETRLNPAGSKVRCTRCGNIFPAYPPPPEDFDDEASGDFLAEAGPAAEAGGLEEELGLERPKKGGWLKRILILIILLVILLGLAFGAMVFLKRKDIHLDKSFLKIDLYEVVPFLKPAAGPPSEKAAPKEGVDPGNARIHMEGVEGRFLDSPQAGRMFLITGRVKNAYGEPVSHIKLCGFLHTQTERKAAEAEAYAGNVLGDEELKSLAKDVISSLLLQPGGKDQINVGVTPGKSIDFMIVFFDLPQNLAEYTIEVVSSQKARSAG